MPYSRQGHAQRLFSHLSKDPFFFPFYFSQIKAQNRYSLLTPSYSQVGTLRQPKIFLLTRPDRLCVDADSRLCHEGSKT